MPINKLAFNSFCPFFVQVNVVPEYTRSNLISLPVEFCVVYKW